MLYTQSCLAKDNIPLSEKLGNVEVREIEGKEKIILDTELPASVALKRILAEIIVKVDFSVPNYKLTGAELHSVPKGASYGTDRKTVIDIRCKFPALADGGFTHTNNMQKGFEGLDPVTDGASTVTTYHWFMPENRRGVEEAGIADPKLRCIDEVKRPNCSYVRITLTKQIEFPVKEIYYDILLGEETRFTAVRNHKDTYNIKIKGSADHHEKLALSHTDPRVTGNW